MNRCFPHQVMASVGGPPQETFGDLLTNVLSNAPEPGHTSAINPEATYEAAACVDLSALDGLNLDFPPLNSNNSNNYSSVSEVVAAAIMATSEDNSASIGPAAASVTASMQQPHSSASAGNFSGRTKL